MTSSPPPERALRLLLRPPAYRARYGPEMVECLRRDRAASGGGPGFWVGVVADHAEAAWKVRAEGRRRGMGRMRDDLVAAWRSVRRAPWFTAVAVATLALGVGATTGVFTVVDRVVLRPLPYEGAERLRRVGPIMRHQPGTVAVASPALMLALEESHGPMEVVAGTGGGTAILTGAGDPERVGLRRVTRDYFELFGERAAVGRLLEPADHEAGAAPVAVLAHEQWVARFGGDPAVLGRSLVLDGTAHTVVGVLEPGPVPVGVRGDGGIVVPLRLRDGDPVRGSFYIFAAARLRPGATADQLDAHVRAVVETVYPPGDGPNFLVGGGSIDLRDEVVGDLGSALGRVLAAVALLLLIACVNVASLLLTRGAERRRELAVRGALGAGRGRVLRQLLAENAILATLGAVGGAALAAAAVALFRRHAPPGIPRLAEATLDGRVFVVALAASLLTVTVFGLLPALRATARVHGLAGSARGGATDERRDGRLRGLLVALETALAVVLVVGSGLLARDLTRMVREDPGFRPDGLAAVRLSLDGRPDDEDETARAAFWTRALEEALALPGAERAVVTTQLPYTSDGIVTTFTPDGHMDGEGEWITTIAFEGDLLGTLGMRLVEGRSFDAVERAGERPAALVNEAFLRRYWPDQDGGVGRRIKEGAPDVEDEGWFDVVGVVADVRHRPGVDPAPTVYLPMRAEAWTSMDVLVRTAGDAAALGPSLRALVRRLDPGMPISRIATVESLGVQARATPRFYTGLFGGFAVVALLLAVVGVYGTTAYVARARTREMGIRMALGAQRTGLVVGAVARAGLLVGAGVAVGLGVAAAVAGHLGESLYYVEPRDLPTYAVVGALVLTSGLLAAWVPARRAGRLDPAATLREDAS